MQETTKPKYTNLLGVSLPMAVWLATDNYGGRSQNPYQISATTFLKSPRQIVLNMRAKDDSSTDVSAVIKSRIGTAIHSAVEESWTNEINLVNALKNLGYPEELIKNIVVNPKFGEVLLADAIPVYLEQRHYKPLGKWTITGEFDFVFDGALSDIKSTGTFTYSNKTKDDDYIKQGSIYRWLAPHIITKNTFGVDFVFTDFKQNSVGQPGYPVKQVLREDYELMSYQATENWMNHKLDLIETLELTDETDLPFCTDKELWRRESVFKYYKSGQVSARSTKNFDNAADAYAKKAEDGNTGLVLEIPGPPTACLYCNVSDMCTQKNIYIHSGELVL